ncbi:MAG: hypothetical protein ISR69_07515 [Gammaproteobacteria bacterium]|nr:hypothetical protein [Gammaproteobacteria bacterium]
MKKTIQIVLDTKGWILEVLANKCYDELSTNKEKFNVSLKVGLGDPGKDIYIHFIYLSAQIIPNAVNIVYVTHIDRYHKAFRLVRLSRKNAFSVTMSTSTEELVKKYTGVNNVIAQVPKSIHFNGKDNFKKITFGIFSNLYPDKRKDDKTIAEFLSIANNFSQNIHVIIMGSGFNAIIKANNSLSYDYYNNGFNVKDYKDNLIKCDYVVYFGRDEGAISILDASTLDIPIIAIEQGYHKDICLSKYSKLCKSSNEMISVIKGICNQTLKQNSYINWNAIVDNLIKNEQARGPSFFRYFLIPFIKNEFSIEGEVNVRKLKKILKLPGTQ